VITTSPTLDTIGFLATGFLLLKSNKEYVLTFKILAQVLVGLFSSKLCAATGRRVVRGSRGISGCGNSLGKVRGLGRRAASAGGGLERGHRGVRHTGVTSGARARDIVVRRCSGRHRDRAAIFEIEKLHFFNTSAQIFEHESCRSHYALQL
jgi:hypothetical protein